MSNYKFGYVPAKKDRRRKDNNDQRNADYDRRDRNRDGNRRY